MTIRLALPVCLALAAPAQAFDMDAMTPEERAAFQAEVRTYLLENPEVIRDAIGVLQLRERQAEILRDQQLARANADALFNDAHSFVGGNPDGDITIVEFMDYRCGYCKRAFPEVEALLGEDTNIRFVVKELPILGEPSLLASRYAVATKIVAGDAAYKDIHDTLMEFDGEITPAALTRLSEAFVLDHAAITAAMDSDEVTDVLVQNRALADQLQITGTPAFVVGDQMVRGFIPADQMLLIVADLRGQSE
ncbi:DsbA family protein [Yoonia sp. BS5-3]|uniref:DsbA family protein n=1 Tax=Yoonia phaeophyticola TaxID=3137369 RepID=A0ABZ2V1B8_9RHOB